ncbi:MAG: purine-nucleoside phosphorylase [Desulfobacteraceae bacterium]|nr:MAG: purine-nucleoside phosphorylase [Desulfobacteraceae bacterium]
MSDNEQKVIRAAEFIRSEGKDSPEIAIITGTGLGDIASRIEQPVFIPYEEIPGFPVSTVEGHPGKLIQGILGGKPVLVLQGRFHLYEGYSPLEVCFPIRVLQMLQIKILVVTNAAGGLNLSYTAGDIMIITDHINLTGENPLVGPNRDDWGLRFPDMSRVYDRELAGKALEAAAMLGLDVKQGVYAGLRGPSLETPAENRYLQRIGADAVGFSTMMEVIAAVHARMRILGLSMITNINNPDCPEPTTLESVIRVAGKAAGRMESIIVRMLEGWDAEPGS